MQDLPSDDESEATPVYLFLAAAGLIDFIPTFAKEHIDMDALMLLTEEDLVNLKLPLGPRRKLLKAINERKSAIENPGEVADSQLWGIVLYLTSKLLPLPLPHFPAGMTIQPF